jgi:hypothetical protein
MTELLNLAMKAHGGLERWKQVRNMQAKVTLNGTLWQIKGRPDGLSDVVMRLDTKEPDLTITPFPKPGTAGHFAPSRVWIEQRTGFSQAGATKVEDRTGARRSYANISPCGPECRNPEAIRMAHVPAHVLDSAAKCWN